MLLKRRDFLLALGAFTLAPGAAWARIGKAVTGQRPAGIPVGMRGTMIMGQAGRVNLMSLRSGKVSSIAAPLNNGHSINLHPHNHNVAVAVDLDDGIAAVVDLRARKCLATIAPENEHWLSGHGCFSPDGKKFFLSETPSDFTKTGHVRVLDTTNWKTLAKFSSGAAQTHMILSVDQGRSLAVGHYGSLPHVDNSFAKNGDLVFLSAEDGKELSRVKASSEEFSFCHLASTAKGELLVSTRRFRWRSSGVPKSRDNHFPSPFLVVAAGGKTTQEFLPADFSDHMRFNFTVAMDEKDRTAMLVHHLDGCISFWDLEKRSLQATRFFAGEQLVGIGQAPGKDYYLATTSSGKCFVLDKKSLASVYTYDLREKQIAPGAHFEVSPGEFVS